MENCESNLHKAGKPEGLVESYWPLSPTSCLGKLLEKALADNLSNSAEDNKKFNKHKMDSNKTVTQMTIYLNFLKHLHLVSIRATQLHESFLMSRKPSTKFGTTVLSLS